MAGSNSAAVRRAMRAILRRNADLASVVPAARIYSQKVDANPVYPLIRMGSPSAVPIRAACVDGSDTIVAVHAFATPRKEGDAIVEEPDDFADRIGALIAGALDRQAVDISGGRARIIWTGEQLLRDPDEADCFHTVQNFRVRAITA